MFKSNRIILALAALSLAGCGPVPSQSERNETAKARSIETTHIICKQGADVVFEADVIRWYTYNAGVQGTIVDGTEFSVSGSACTMKANSNVAKN